MTRKMKTTEQYIQELVDEGKNFYPLHEYEGALTPIEHECFNGHRWKAAPNDCIKGNNCPTCTKLGIEPVKLYHVSFEWDNQTYYKIGISNQPLSRRYRGKWFPLNMKELWSISYPNRYFAKAAEQTLLGQNISSLVNVGALQSRGGDTETLSVQVEKPAN